mgnify:CR=1 FL=1
MRLGAAVVLALALAGCRDDTSRGGADLTTPCEVLPSAAEVSEAVEIKSVMQTRSVDGTLCEYISEGVVAVTVKVIHGKGNFELLPQVLGDQYRVLPDAPLRSFVSIGTFKRGMVVASSDTLIEVDIPDQALESDEHLKRLVLAVADHLA